MRLNPHLNFNGRCREAFELYAKLLGGKITMTMTYGESPMAAKTPPEQHTNVLHTALEVGDQLLTGADAPPEYYEKPQGTSVLFSLSNNVDAERIFAGLAEGGNVTMPIQKTFWADRFGMLTDRFGTPWMINCSERASVVGQFES